MAHIDTYQCRDASPLAQAVARGRVALAHDYLNQNGGAERVLLALQEVFPTAPLFTSIYDRRRMPAVYQSLDIRTSFMQRLPGVSRHHQAYLPLYPFAFERFDLSAYDLVISSSSAWAKGIITPATATHICYCHAPMRFAWSYQNYVAGERINPITRSVLPALMVILRMWDVTSAARVDHFVANSRAVAGRIAKFYRRTAEVIHPPVDTNRFAISPTVDDYYLIVQRLVPYKRLDLVIDAFNRLRRPLRIVGEGRARADLERIAGPTIEFTGHLTDDALRDAFARCRAYIVPGEEDFAIAPVEAQAAGRPVVAYAAGGVLETVIPGRSGIFFHEPTADALAAAVQQLDTMLVVPQAIREHAQTFDTSIFQQRMQDLAESVLVERQARIR